MKNSTWNRDTQRFVNRGLDLVRTVKEVEPGYYTRLTNVTSREEGSLTHRPGRSLLAGPLASASEITRIGRLDDPAGGVPFTRIYCTADGQLYTGPAGTLYQAVTVGTLTSADKDRPSIAGWRPTSESKAFAYIGAPLKNIKVDTQGNYFNVGIAPPVAEIPPPQALAQSAVAIDSLAAVTGWTPTGGTLLATAPVPPIEAVKLTREDAPAGVGNVVEFTVTESGGTAKMTKVQALNLDEGFDDNSRIEIFVRPEFMKYIKEIQFVFNIDTQTADFTREFFIWTATRNQLQEGAEGVDELTLRAAQQEFYSQLEQNLEASRAAAQLNARIHGGIVPTEHIPTADEVIARIPPEFWTSRVLSLGNNVWTALSLRRGDFIRGGTKRNRGWNTVTGIEIRVLTEEFPTGVSSTKLQFYQWDIFGTSGLDSTLGLPYDWRYTYYASQLGVESNPSPIQSSSYHVAKKVMNLRVTASTDGQVDKIRIYRRGGVLGDWFQEDEITNATGDYPSYRNDLSIAANPLLHADNDQPVTILGRMDYLGLHSQKFDEGAWAKTGITVAPDKVTDPEGNNKAARLTSSQINATILQTVTAAVGVYTFSGWLRLKEASAGTVSITANGGTTWVTIPVTQAWARYQVTATTTVPSPNPIFGMRLSLSGMVVGAFQWQLTPGAQETVPVKTEGTAKILPDHVIHGAPLGQIFGPFQGKYALGVNARHPGSGLPAHPGRLWISKPHNFDSWPSDSWVEVTSPSEALLTGCLYDGRAYVFSSQKMYVVYPPTVGDGFNLLDTSCNVGVLAPHLIAVGPSIWFVSSDGVYETKGGEARNITQNSFVRNLFSGQHPGNVDFTKPHQMSLIYRQPYLDFFYTITYEEGGTQEQRILLRYDIEFERWEVYTSTHGHPVVTGFWDHKARQYLMGTTTGYVMIENRDLPSDAQPSPTVPVPIDCLVRTGAWDQGLGDEEKVYGDLWVDYDPKGSSLTVKPLLNAHTRELAGTALATTTGRRRTNVPLGLGDGETARDIGLDVTWSGAGILYGAEIAFRPRGHERVKLASEWTDDGKPYDKFFWGCSLRIDTFEQAKTIHIQGDGRTRVTQTIPVPINTTVSSSVGTTITPASMANIHQGMRLMINAVERRVVSVTATSFTVDAGSFTNGWAILAAAGQSVPRVVELSWSAFRATSVRIISEDTVSWLHGDPTWYHVEESPRVNLWETGWDKPAQGADVYCWGVEILCDTSNLTKTVEASYNGGTAIGTYNIQANGPSSVRLTWAPVKASSLRLRATDANTGYLYRWNWLTDLQREVEPPPVVLFTANWEPANQGLDSYVVGVELELECVGGNVTVTVERDGGTAVSSTVLTSPGIRNKQRVTWPTVKAKNLRLKLEGTNPLRIYRWTWLTGDEPPSVVHWDSNWVPSAKGQDMYVIGLELEVDTGGAAKQIVVTRDGGTAVSTQNVTTTGRAKARITWPAVQAGTLRFVSTATAARLYDYTWLLREEPPALTHWDSEMQDAGNLDDKWISGLYLDCDTAGANKSVTVEVDGTAVTGSPFTINSNGRKPVKISFGGVRGVMMRFHSTAVSARLWKWDWKWSALPVELTNFATGWEDNGWPYEKYLKAIIIDAETAGAKQVALRINGNEGTNVQTITINHSGRDQSYHALTDQVLARTVRLAPIDGVAGRLYGASFVWDREPVKLIRQMTQETSFNQNGPFSMPYFEIGLRSQADVTASVLLNGEWKEYLIKSTAGKRERARVHLDPIKTRETRFKFESAQPLQIYLEDSHVVVYNFQTPEGKSYSLPFEGGVENP